MNQLLSFILIALTSLSLSYAKENNNTSTSLIIDFNKIRNKKGVIHVFLYNYENQYPYNPYLNFELDKKEVSNGQLSFAIPNLAPGNYAVSVIDDENANSDLDLFLGMPTEGYGFSNNIKPLLSFPNFKQLLFTIPSTPKTITLNLQYFI